MVASLLWCLGSWPGHVRTEVAQGLSRWCSRKILEFRVTGLTVDWQLGCWGGTPLPGAPVLASGKWAPSPHLPEWPCSYIGFPLVLSDRCVSSLLKQHKRPVDIRTVSWSVHKGDGESCSF